MERDSTAIASSELEKDTCIEEYILQGAVPRSQNKDTKSTEGDDSKNGKTVHSDDYDEEYLMQKLSMLQLRLDQATKTLQVERE